MCFLNDLLRLFTFLAILNFCILYRGLLFTVRNVGFFLFQNLNNLQIFFLLVYDVDEFLVPCGVNPAAYKSIYLIIQASDVNIFTVNTKSAKVVRVYI